MQSSKKNELLKNLIIIYIQINIWVWYYSELSMGDTPTTTI